MKSLSEWQEKERVAGMLAVDEHGCLLDNLTLELRVHPPEINVDNVGANRSTVLTIDSANRPGSLIFVSALINVMSGVALMPPRHAGSAWPTETDDCRAGGATPHRAWVAHKQRADLKRRGLVP